MAENGEEKLLAMARHIAKTLGHNDNMADDILQIFSNFDGRFSREKLASDDERTRSCAALELSLKSLDRRISQYVAADHPIWSYSADSAAFLDLIDDLIATIRDWTPMADDQSVGVCLARAEYLMRQAMFRLEDEFRSLVERGGESRKLNRAFRGESNGALSFDSGDDEEEGEEEVIGDGEEHQIPTAQPIGDYDIVIDALPSGTINDLHEIAKRMVAAGFGKQCSHVYSSCRREFLEESMSRLGLQKLSIEEVQKTPWQDLEDEIERWIKSANVALRILFPSERRLCDRIFYGLSSAADLSFMEVCRGSTIQILNFADAVAIGSRSPERLFRILDVFETMRDLMPEFELVFSDHYCLFLRNEANTIWKRLGEAIRGIFMELENLISRDPPKTPVPGGGLHPITRYVMNYLRAACRSRQTLEQVFEDSAAVSHQPKVDDRASSSPMSVQMAWIMELLESNLETKSKIYGDSALCCVFMMNNGRYIMQKVKDSELGSLLGDDWIRKHTAKIRQYLVNYQRSSWNKVLGVLKPESGSLSPSAAVKSMKEKLKLFNIYFDEICKTQSNWVVFDDQLRDDLRISLVKILLPAYQSFIGRFQNVPEIGRHGKYIKYTSEDIHAKINGLFRGGRGSAGAGGGRK
ncbi:exocyst complex component EXO70B1-like [Pyrus ussuriensis x Pyrus communis]|uniref:Exocyst subunit Exo70 family protein n=1 Tax=Pyrus ussuriensis x Pyrus communis TaxID=2448454 RepID=A0A5N5GRY2_9ROSA|nr:exocyst complex component EXO70B1-like [Pyrus ussuriensis x Pyrus communis]